MSDIRAAITSPQITLQSGSEYLATFSHPDGIAEQTVFDFNTQFVALIGKRIKNISIFADAVNLTQSATFRVKVAIDGATLRTISSLVWTIADDDGVFFDLASCNINFSLTAQSSVTEGAARNIPVRVVFEQMEK